MIEKLYYTKECKDVVKGISNNICNRCLGSNIYTDPSGKQFCLDCYEYGEIHEDIKLYRSIRTINNEKHIATYRYPLTEKQIEGSKFLLKCYHHRKQGFLQAVCGAGKTEMTYEVIVQALKENKKVCFVLPRVEVLKEVYSRFTIDFPNTTIKMMYQDNKDYDDAPLLFSTPQQLIIFYHEFDLIIVDEVDAFPYANNQLLERFTNKSLKRNGIVMYLSATITKQFLARINNRQIWHFTISSRHHGMKLPIPTYIRVRNDKDEMDKLLSICKNKMVKERQALIFVPTKNIGKKIYEYLNNENIACHFISSATTNKKRIIKDFKNKIVSFLITTTLLERGVTFKDIDCFVINADHEVFSKSTLIQISGRVGRMKEHQDGEVIYLSKQVTLAMKRSRKEIMIMNKRNKIEMQAM